KKRPRLLHIEALNACGEVDRAAELAQYKLDSDEFDADYYCALANTIPAGVAEASERLTLLNRIYAQFGLATADLADVQKGFVFGNLRVPSEKVGLVRE